MGRARFRDNSRGRGRRAPREWTSAVSPHVRRPGTSIAGDLRRTRIPICKNGRDRCIRIRTGRGHIYKWEFECGEDRRQIDVPGLITCGDTALSIRAALDGLGLYYCLEKLALPYVAEQRLEIVLDDWASIGPGYAMYYSSRRQVPPGIRALIEVIRDIRPLG